MAEAARLVCTRQSLLETCDCLSYYRLCALYLSLSIWLCVPLFMGLVLWKFGKAFETHWQGVKRPERKAHHSPPSCVEVKNTWSYTYTSAKKFPWRVT